MIRKTRSEEFIIPAYDHSGRTVRIRILMPPGLGKMLDQILESHRFPFQTRDDLIRWCLLRGVRELGSMESVSSFLPQLELMIEILRAQYLARRLQEFFELLDRVVFALDSSGVKGRARKFVQLLSQLIMCIESGTWRTQCLNELRRRWGHLLVAEDGVERSPQ